MFLETTAIVVFWASLSGLIIILIRKIPSLLKIQVPENIPSKKIVIDKIKVINPWKNFSYKKSLAKLLLRFKILNLKLENTTSHWIEKLRSGSIKKEKDFPEQYWHKLEEDDVQKGDNDSDK